MKNILISNRIPKDFFVARGSGQSDITLHAGSYHLSLKEAGIEQANVMQYSSILPRIAQEVPYKRIEHGAVLETIMAVSNTENGEICSCGIIYGWLYDKKNNQKFGGLVCEHYGNEPVEEIENRLHLSLQELYINGFDEEYELKDIKLISNSYQPTKKYGTTLVSLCFINYVVPIIEE